MLSLSLCFPICKMGPLPPLKPGCEDSVWECVGKCLCEVSSPFSLSPPPSPISQGSHSLSVGWWRGLCPPPSSYLFGRLGECESMAKVRGSFPPAGSSEGHGKCSLLPPLSVAQGLSPSGDTIRNGCIQQCSQTLCPGLPCSPTTAVLPLESDMG